MQQQIATIKASFSVDFKRVVDVPVTSGENCVCSSRLGPRVEGVGFREDLNSHCLSENRGYLILESL